MVWSISQNVEQVLCCTNCLTEVFQPASTLLRASVAWRRCPCEYPVACPSSRHSHAHSWLCIAAAAGIPPPEGRAARASATASPAARERPRQPGQQHQSAARRLRLRFPLQTTRHAQYWYEELQLRMSRFGLIEFHLTARRGERR